MKAEYENDPKLYLEFSGKDIEVLNGFIGTIIKYQKKTGFKKLKFETEENALIQKINEILSQIISVKDNGKQDK